MNTAPNAGDPTRTTPSYGDPDGFTSESPYHAGASMPMMHLQGDMGPTYEQEPLDHEVNYMNDRPQSETGITDWDSTSLANTGGDHNPIRSSDHNGYRTPPAQGPTSA